MADSPKVQKQKPFKPYKHITDAAMAKIVKTAEAKATFRRALDEKIITSNHREAMRFFDFWCDLSDSHQKLDFYTLHEVYFSCTGHKSALKWLRDVLSVLRPDFPGDAKPATTTTETTSATTADTQETSTEATTATEETAVEAETETKSEDTATEATETEEPQETEAENVPVEKKTLLRPTPK